MTNVRLLAACLVLATALAADASAQQAGPRPGRGGFNLPAQNQGRRGDASDDLMREAAKEVAKAHTMLSRALPIYNGHRVAAMQDCTEAHKEIAAGNKFDRQHENGKAGQSSATNDNDDPAKYSPEQIKKSNGMLKKAAEVLAHAKGRLQKGVSDYGGHRVAAIKEIDEALKQIHEALGSQGRRR